MLKKRLKSALIYSFIRTLAIKEKSKSIYTQVYKNNVN